MKTWRATLSVAATVFDLFTLDSSPTSDGHVIEDGAGNAYVAWTSEGVGTGVEPVRFCKIAPGGGCSAITLPIPAADQRHRQSLPLSGC